MAISAARLGRPQIDSCTAEYQISIGIACGRMMGHLEKHLQTQYVVADWMAKFDQDYKKLKRIVINASTAGEWIEPTLEKTKEKFKQTQQAVNAMCKGRAMKG